MATDSGTPDPPCGISQMGAFISGEYLFHDNTIASDIDKIHTNDNKAGVIDKADNAVSLTILIPMRLHLPLQRNDIVILRPGGFYGFSGFVDVLLFDEQRHTAGKLPLYEIGRASCRERV